MFLGREKELAIIKKVLTKKSSSVMVYGKRKIGKTTLINHSLKGDSHKTVYYECLKAPMKDNVEGLISANDTPKTRRVSMEEANAFLAVKETTAKLIAYAAFLCILSPICLIILGAMSEAWQAA